MFWGLTCDFAEETNELNFQSMVLHDIEEVVMGKRVVLCADGTWNTPHGVDAVVIDTNVRKLYCALADVPDQLRYYDSGVGTDGTPIDHLTGGAMGQGLFQKIQDNYEYLAYVWDPGDDVYLFGFSRGAYTARSLGGMIARFGVPTKNFDNATVSKIFAAYRETDQAKRAALTQSLSAQYGLTPVSVKMVGVWDTVGSLGIPGLLFSLFDQKQYGFLDTTLHPNVQNAYHAVCIDERRAQFMPTLWANPDGSPRANDAQVTQVWFPGVHCNVGGSYEQSQLSDIAMRWMMKKAIGCGLTFGDGAMKQYLTAVADPLGPAQDEWKIIPWGLPKHRTVPANAVMANTVQARLTGMAAYTPENLRMNGRVLRGYGVEDVLG
jgi:uncharacterized protein (DUF2235 family)